MKMMVKTHLHTNGHAPHHDIFIDMLMNSELDDVAALKYRGTICSRKKRRGFTIQEKQHHLLTDFNEFRRYLEFEHIVSKKLFINPYCFE